MGNIQTGTVCPYPFTFANTSDQTLASCTRTYGEALDPALLIIQAICIGFFGVFALPVFIWRMVKLREFSRETGTPFFSSSQSKIYINAIVFSISVVVSMIDPQGFRNIITPYVYFVFDEVAAASVFLLAYFIVDFYINTARLARRRGKLKNGLSHTLTAAMVVLTYANFIGWQVLAMLFPDLYEVYGAVKLLGALVILAGFAYISYTARRDILTALDRSEHGVDTSLRAAMRWKYPEDISLGLRAVLVTKRKFCEYFSIVGLASAALLAFLLLGLTAESDYSWKYLLEDQLEIAFIGFKVVYILVVIVLLRLFHVPKTASVRETSTTEKASSKLVSGSKNSRNESLANDSIL